MFGDNPIRSEDASDGQSLDVHSIFLTIQGEGPFAGRPAVFVRLWGCNLACVWCDTEFEISRTRQTTDEIVDEVFRVAQGAKLVVITGGEPLRQNIGPLIMQLVENSWEVQIETNGTLWPQNFENAAVLRSVHLVCSPKTPKVHPMVHVYCHHWKYIIDSQQDCLDVSDGLPLLSPLHKNRHPAKLARPIRGPQNTIWVQPCDNRDPVIARNNVQLTLSTVMSYGHRLSFQIHKAVNIP